MTNKHASKQHCLVGNIRPKSKLRNRANKAKAKGPREERQARLAEAILKAKGGEKATKAAPKKAAAQKKEETAA